MKKKIFTSILLFATILFVSITCYANDMDLGSEMRDSADKTSESMQNAGNGVMGFANNIGNGIRDMAEDVGNGIQDTAEGIGSGIQNMFNGDDGNTTTGTNYNATRTSADVAGTTGMANTAWIWLILGITGIVIVALTWYYVSQDTGNNTRR